MQQAEKFEAQGRQPSGLGSRDDDDPRFDSAADSASQQILAAERAALNRLTDDLAAIADWKHELQRKIRIAQLTFELVDCFDTAEQETLRLEVQAFKEVCRRLGETMSDEEENLRREAA
jgi:hypothetical protein